jgi:hypothetical protein
MRDKWYIQVLVGRPYGKRTLGKPKRRWEDNIKIVLQEESTILNTMDRARGTYERQKWYIQVLVGRPDGKRTLGKPKPRREDNIKIVLQEGSWGMD